MVKIEYEIGDCLELIEKLPDNSIDLIFTSPPYECKKKYSDSTRDLGNRSNMEFVNSLMEICRVCYGKLKDIGNFFINFQGQIHNGRYSLVESWIPIKMDQIGYIYIQPHYWYKPNAHPDNYNGRLKNSIETIWHFSKSDKYKVHKDNVRIPSMYAKTDKRTWKYNQLGADPSNLFIHKKSQNQASEHPGLMIFELAKHFIAYGSKRGDMVLDPFLGSGTTLLACRILERNGIGFELNGAYEPVIKEKILDAIPQIETWGHDIDNKARDSIP